MAKLPKVYCTLLLLLLIIVLTGCELRRDNGEIADPAPVSDLPPTLAPLGAETTLDTAAQTDPTTLNADATAAVSNLEAGQAAAHPAEPALPTSEAVDLSGPATESTNSPDQVASPETFTPPAAEAAAADSAPQESIVVDATASDDLPIGGPVAANPPAGQSSGSYDDSVYVEGDYTVQPGDTLFSVAQRFGVTVQDLIAANGLASDVIYAGQPLNITGDAVDYPTFGSEQPAYSQPYAPNAGEYIHVVAPGETLFSIALQYGSSVEAVAAANQLAYPYTIGIGRQLFIPAPGAYAQAPQMDNYNYGPPPGDYFAPDNGYQAIPGNANMHMVAPGDTLFSIAMRYGSSVEAIAGVNSIPFPYTIGPGQPLIIPAPGAYAGPPPPPTDGFGQQPQFPNQGYFPPDNGYGAAPDNFQPPIDNFGGDGTHTVAPGETIFSIAAFYGVSAEMLAGANGLSNPNQIFVGQVLYLP